jgi:ribonuclease BN (tRNA processing enzyme)
MRLEILGCSGGVGGGRRTMALALEQHVLIDAGSGAGDLSLERMAAIEHVFLTHSHLDHVAFLPLLCDAALGLRDGPLTVHALPETIAALKECVFNFRLWPDYSALPSPDRPYIVFEPVALGQTVHLCGCGITPLPARHAVPAVGYRLDSGSGSLVYSGDTTLCDAFWEALNGIENLDGLLIETTFLNRNIEGAGISGHMTPELLAAGLSRLRRNAAIYIVHMEPGREAETMRQIGEVAAAFRPTMLERGDVLEF